MPLVPQAPGAFGFLATFAPLNSHPHLKYPKYPSYIWHEWK